MILQGDKERAEGIHYEVDPSSKPIGIGGMGRVYKGTWVNENTREVKPVAIKFLFEDLPAHAIERARREASIQLRNDQLVEMLGFIETYDESGNGSLVKHYHVVSELLNGVCMDDFLKGDLTDCMGNVVPFAEELQKMYISNRVEFAKTVIKSVLSGLMALHDAGYIHRDIDPSNIMFTSDRHIKLIDFGIARQFNSLSSEDPSYKENIVGKPKYAAPELLSGNLKQQNQTTDLYAVGIMLYQLLCGQLPFEGSMVDVIVMQKTKKIPVKNIQDETMRQIVKKATEKQQSKRYQSASEFRVALDNPEIQKKTPNIFAMMMAGLALLGVALGVLLGLFL